MLRLILCIYHTTYTTDTHAICWCMWWTHAWNANISQYEQQSTCNVVVVPARLSDNGTYSLILDPMHVGKFCTCFCRLLIFLITLFFKIFPGILLQCQTVWIQITPDNMSGARQYVGRFLDSNYMQSLSKDDTSRFKASLGSHLQGLCCFLEHHIRPTSAC